MKDYKSEGNSLRAQIKELIIEFMKSNYACQPNAEGLTQSDIFRACGLDWGDQEKAESTKQQYWVIAVLRVLENEGKVQRDVMSKRWRVT